MWVVPAREEPDHRCEKLLSLYDAQLQKLEGSRPTPWWDGHCGLVKVQDEDLVRPDASQPPVAHFALPQRHGALHQKRLQRGAAPAQAAAAAVATPPSPSPRSSPRGSPFKAAPGALLPPGKQSAAALTEQAAMLLQAQGRLQDAEPLLHRALQQCPLTDTGLAARIVDLLLECEREQQETPTHSRAGSEMDQLDSSGSWVASSAGSGSGSSAAAAPRELLRQAVAALAAGEARRALQHLQRAQQESADPQERRRIELYMELIRCKRSA